ncbi:MAG: hypothetical protein PHD48_08330 [Alphaproteobacteria bacterium]|nr:hypothetical protein [Alphaproteobacteria bacterium]
MTSLSSTSAINSSLTSALTQVGRKKLPSRDEIFATQDEETAKKAEESKATVADFLSYARMSPAERIRADFLKDHNLTEESLASMSSTEREKIEEQIKQLVKTKLGLNENQKAGQLVDVTV